MEPSHTALCLALSGALALLAHRPLGSRRDPTQFRQEEAEDSHRIGAYRQAGLHKDRARIPEILADLPPVTVEAGRPTPWPDYDSRVPEGYVLTMLRALAQMGATEALPQIQSYAGTFPDSGLSRFATAAAARLLAETENGGAGAKVRRMLRELGMTVADLNAAIEAHYNPKPRQLPDGRTVHIVFSHPPPPPLGVYALRELADMVYQGDYADYAPLPEIAELDFSRDYACTLKLRLAPLPPAERLATLIDELSHRTVVRGETSCDLQLAINEGAEAAESAVVELSKMEGDRAAYNQADHHAGFSCMFRVIAGVGDPMHLPVLERFLSDTDHWVRHYARIAYNDLRWGWKRDRVAAY